MASCVGVDDTVKYTQGFSPGIKYWYTRKTVANGKPMRSKKNENEDTAHTLPGRLSMGPVF